MAGTNDLLSESPATATAATTTAARQAAEVVRAIQKLHLACHQRSVNTLAFSMPDFGSPELLAKREAWLQVNGLLKDWVSGSNRGDPNSGLAAGKPALFVDSSVLLPCDKASIDRGLWDEDRVHFSPAGSRHFGRALAQHVLSYFGVEAVGGSPDEDMDAPSGLGELEEGGLCLVLGGAAAAGAGASLAGPGGWAFQLADALEESGLKVENKALLGSRAKAWQELLESPGNNDNNNNSNQEFSDLLAQATVVLLSLTPQDEMAADLVSASLEQVVGQFAESYRHCARAIRARCGAKTRVVLGGPHPPSSSSEDQRKLLVRLRDVMSAWDEVDHVIDFLQGCWGDEAFTDCGLPNDLGHQQLLTCVNRSLLLG
ncbi:unnamed protein product [Polarella glacialis]|uniref:SGNH hydrolase-type esterase domain-containing protein n=1 Tax=Polarella glacialis TaxID=89957 RepID=A0A813HB72_POLGL|nr:unnamed protein product [Polarella glacialis]